MPEQADTASDSVAASPTVTLWREIDALGGSFGPDGDSAAWGSGYSEALTDVLAILERRGHSEHEEPLTVASADRASIYTKMKSDPLKYLEEGTLDTAYRDYPYYTGDAIRMVTQELRETRGELEGMRQNRDNLRAYLAERTEQRDNARDERDAAEQRAKRARAIMQAVIDMAIRPPATIERALKVPPGKRQAHEAAELALWQQSALANAVRFVAELATMTDIEAEFLDGHELRSIAQLLQVPDDEGNRAPTVPRLYSDEDRNRAIAEAALFQAEMFNPGELVDTVAEALGMRRAGA